MKKEKIHLKKEVIEKVKNIIIVQVFEQKKIVNQIIKKKKLKE